MLKKDIPSPCAEDGFLTGFSIKTIISFYAISVLIPQQEETQLLPPILQRLPGETAARTGFSQSIRDTRKSGGNMQAVFYGRNYSQSSVLIFSAGTPLSARQDLKVLIMAGGPEIK